MSLVRSGWHPGDGVKAGALVALFTTLMLSVRLGAAPLHGWLHACAIPEPADPFAAQARAVLLESHLRCPELGEPVRFVCSQGSCEADFTPPWFGDPHTFALECASTPPALLVTTRIVSVHEASSHRIEGWTATLYPPTAEAREDVSRILGTVYGVSP